MAHRFITEDALAQIQVEHGKRIERIRSEMGATIDGCQAEIIDLCDTLNKRENEIRRLNDTIRQLTATNASQACYIKALQDQPR